MLHAFYINWVKLAGTKTENDTQLGTEGVNNKNCKVVLSLKHWTLEMILHIHTYRRVSAHPYPYLQRTGADNTTAGQRWCTQLVGGLRSSSWQTHPSSCCPRPESSTPIWPSPLNQHRTPPGNWDPKREDPYIRRAGSCSRRRQSTRRAGRHCQHRSRAPER
jgi:hypothetical protein